MALRHRVKKLERLAGVGLCPECGGDGKYVVSYINEHDPVPEVQGCPTCGEAQHIVVKYVQETSIREPDTQVHNLRGNSWRAG